MKAGDHHIVVIGGGISGATAALLLAKHGRRVTLVEKAGHLCPTLRGFTRKGVFFDTGLHYSGELGANEILDTYLGYLGMGSLPKVALNPAGFDVIRFSDGRCIALPAGLDALSAALHAAFPKDSHVIKKYLDTVCQIFASSSFLNFSVAGAQEKALDPLWMQTLEAFLSCQTSDEDLKTVLSIHCLLHGVSPQEVSLLHHARVSASYYRSAHTFAGGGKTLADAFATRLEEEGVSLKLGHAVDRILFTPAKTIAGVMLKNGERVDADSVVYTAHPYYLPDMVPEDALRAVFKKRLKQLRETISAYILFGATNHLPEHLHRRNLFLCQAKTPLGQAFARNKPPDHGPFYVTSSHFVPDHSPSNVGVEVFVPGWLGDMGALATEGHKRTEGYRTFKRQTLIKVRESLLKTCPELECVAFFDGATPLTLRDYLSTPYGGLYGVAHTADQFNPLPVTRIPELFLAGQAVVAPGLLGAVVSAFLACSFILGLEKLKDEVAAWHPEK